MTTLLDIIDRETNAHGPTLAHIRAEAQKAADESGEAIAVGWTVNDQGDKEYGYCPAIIAPSNAFVVEVLETVEPYKGGRADYATRQETRRDRLESAADRSAREASARFTNARRQVAGIPPGQPILVGHHSERHHRRALEKHDTNMRAGIDAQERAADLASRASSVGTGGVSSDDPEALIKLRAELAQLEKLQDTMKNTNAIVRKYGSKAPEKCIELLMVAGLSERMARSMLTPDAGGRLGVPAYSLTNNNASIRRVRQRIEDLQKVATIEEGERARSKSGVVFQIGDNRVQLLFPSKPAEAIRTKLKREGFRWAPSAGAWQRNLNNAGIYNAQAIIDWLDREGL